MFQEFLADFTAERLRVHLPAYLQTVQEAFTGQDRLTLLVPKIDNSTYVGGILEAPIEDLPLMAVTCGPKNEIPSNESLCYYEYTGGISGMFVGSSAYEVERLAKRYAAATELFIREHQYLEQHATDSYMVREFLYQGTTFVGATEINLDEEKPKWLDGFTHVVRWYLSEDQYRQHQ